MRIDVDPTSVNGPCESQTRAEEWDLVRRGVAPARRTLDDERNGKGRTLDAGLKRDLEAKVYAGERLTRADGIALYESDDLAWLGRLAPHKRTEMNGDRVMFNGNRHLNLTNVCSASCAYCSFQRKPGEKAAYTMRIDEAVAKAREM